jgi:2'-5' RNA ligase
MAALDEDFIFDELVLYESILGPQGPHYSPLAQASLTGGA